MISTLTWSPAAGGGTQTVQFKPHTAADWISYQTVSATTSTIGVTGLDYNTLYDFQIVNNCPTGATTALTNSDIKIQCPTLTISPADISTSVQFFHLGGSIDSYIVQLLDSGSSQVLQTKTLTAPFSTSVVTSFAGLSPLTTYNIKVIPTSGVISKSDCATTSFTTTNTPTCPAPISLAVTFS